MTFAVFSTSCAVFCVLAFLYARKLGAVWSYSQKNDLPIFGQRYKSILTLSADGYFLNELFAGKQICDTEDHELRNRLRAAQTVLRWNIGLGLFMLLFVLGLGFTS